MLRTEHLMREIELGALNTKRYRTLWREMMMRIKMPQIVEDVEIAWRNFDRALDIKDYRISFLMDELAEAEEQYQRNTRLHIEIIDRLLMSYRKRLEYEERNYQRTLNETLVQTDAEVNKIYYQQNEAEISLQSITHDVQQQLEESLNNVKSIALKTKDRRKYYEALKDKDEKDQQVIAQQLLRTADLFEEIRKFRGKITTYDATTRKEISEILTEYDFFQKASWTMKNRLLSEQTKDKNQLKVLSIEYNKTIKDLERLVIKSKRLLTLMQICRKYETQYEKVIPFSNHTEPESSPIPSSHQISALSDWDMSRQVHTDKYVIELLNFKENMRIIDTDFKDLINFWRRFGSVQIATIKLRSEKDKLEAETSYLRKCINSYIMQKE